MKKTLALLLALLMVFTMLVGCGSKDNASDADTGANDAGETNTDAGTADDAGAADEGAADAGDATTDEGTTDDAGETDAGTGVGLTILYEQDDSMINNYSAIAVNPDAPFVDADGNAVADVYVNVEGAKALINWLMSEEATQLIANYGFEEYGEYLFYTKEGKPTFEGEIAPATEETKVIRLSTTTSVNDSGLLGYLLPTFESTYGYTVEVASAGTGKAIAAAKAGNADLILVHSKSQEEAFVEGGFAYVLEGYEAERLTFMYNYFVLCGPAADPAGCADAPTVKDAFKLIADGEYTFVSRGDGSGTHTKEISLWDESLGITTDAASVEGYSWYQYSNAGMGACLAMAEQMGGYILSDKATVLTFQANNGIVE